jgi:hypothetical protein
MFQTVPNTVSINEYTGGSSLKPAQNVSEEQSSDAGQVVIFYDLLTHYLTGQSHRQT